MIKRSLLISELVLALATLQGGVASAQSGARAADVITPQDEFRQRAESAAAEGRTFIENFQAHPAPDLQPGSQVHFSLRGTPGAKVDLAIKGVRGVIELPEVRYGEYATNYTIRSGDRLSESSNVNVTMRFRSKVATAALGQRLGAGPATGAATGSSSAGATASAALAAGNARGSCADCASVESVKVVSLSGGAAQGQGAQGAQSGGAWTTAIGPGESYRYDVILRYPDGRIVTMPMDDDPGLASGEQVRVRDGVLIRHTGEP